MKPRYNEGPRKWQNLFAIPRFRYTVEPRYNEPLYNQVLGITNDFPYPSNSKMYEKEPGYITAKPRNSEQILPVP